MNELIKYQNILEMQMNMVWQIPIATLAGVGSFYFGSALSKRKNKYNLCCFSSAVLLFQSIFIFLPQIHLRTVQLLKHAKGRTFVDEEDEIFPLAFALTAIIFSVSLLIDKIFLRMYISKGNQQKHDQRNYDVIRYFVPIGAGFILFNNYFYNNRDTNVLPQFSISTINSILINISSGYIHSWTGPKSSTKRHLAFMTNILPIIAGVTLGILQNRLLFLSLLGLVGCGILIYSVTLLILPLMLECDYDIKSKFLSIVGGFLITVLYYPACHLMNV